MCKYKKDLFMCKYKKDLFMCKYKKDLFMCKYKKDLFMCKYKKKKKKLITNQTFIVFKNKHSNSPSYLLILNRPFF